MQNVRKFIFVLNISKVLSNELQPKENTRAWRIIFMIARFPLPHLGYLILLNVRIQGDEIRTLIFTANICMIGSHILCLIYFI